VNITNRPAGALIQAIGSLGTYLLARPVTIGFLAFSCALLGLFGWPVSWLSRTLVGFATLMQGPRSGLNVLAWSLLPSIALGLTGQWLIFAYSTTLGIGIYWAAYLWNRFHSGTALLEYLTFLGLAFVLGAHLLVSDLAQKWVQRLMLYSGEMQHLFQSAGITASVVTKKIHFIAQIATGFQATLLLLGVFFSFCLALAWQGILKRPQLREVLYNIRSGYVLSILLLIAVLAGLLGWGPVYDSLPVLMLSFTLSALSALHAMLSDKPYGRRVLVSFYLIFFWLWPYMVIGLTILGLADVYYDCRTRWHLKSS